ncbi:restriction endonuclease subunit S [Acinetobacter entericus]|uniref:Restriction endonuclease subunit S n=1 Tax=Acinetobacter entericus TaxID=2989714 RepID=A0ABT3NN50_9GAMM|nr:restriction endonuclease subunit S [Acinetobacter entericus]MCW8040973.1 restriction endonuclease subunit S [Acinetobacter entericus]
MVKTAAKYQAYAEYKDSGVEWVGDIPSTWDVKPVLALFSSLVEKNTDGYESNVLSLSYGRIVRRDIEDNFGLLPESFNTYQIVKNGDIILRLTDLQNDKRSLRVGLVKEKGIITSAYLKLSVNQHIDPRFAYRLLHSYDTTKVFYGMGGGLRQSMKFEDFKRLPILLPSKDEQIKIANFLDHETAKIDHLIEKQQQLIELLKEKRQAVISHAVTKGLNPNVPMKDSGVEWLGEVPEHWKIIKGGYIGTLFGSESIQEDDVTDQGSLPFIKVSSLSAETFKLSNIDWFVSERRAKFCKAEKNYIVFPKRGAAIFTNKVNVIEVDSVIDPNLMGWKIGKQGITEYFALLLKTRGLDDIADVSTVPQINNKHIAPEKFPLPTLSEQCEIVKFVGMELTKFDEMILKAESAIQLMQERRTALISAAVTGKIDVRHWQAPTVAEADTEFNA